MPFEDVEVTTGDTRRMPYAVGTFASRAAVMSGSAIALAARQVRAKALRIAADALEVSEDDLEIVDGQVQVKGAPATRIALGTVAVLSNPLRYAFDEASKLATQFTVGDTDKPPVAEDDEPGLEGKDFYSPERSTFASGMHAVIVETDPDTCEITVLKYAVVHDCGNLINPMIVEGQIHGGVAQGIGGALYERMAYDEHGQLQNASFMDFLMPYATRDARDHRHRPPRDAVAAEPARPQGCRGGRRHPVGGGVRVGHRGRRGVPDPRHAHLAVGALRPAGSSTPTEGRAHEDHRRRGPARPGRRRSGRRCWTRRCWSARIPGCERLETTGENSYAMTVTVGVAAIRGTYAGTCSLQRPRGAPSRLRLSAEGAGAPGTIAADVDVRFADNGRRHDDARLRRRDVVGGMIGGVGQRMLGSVSRRMAAEFFGALEQVLTGVAAGRRVAAAARGGRTGPMPSGLHRPAPPGAPRAQQDFLRGVAVGAGLVTLGVVLGSLRGSSALTLDHFSSAVAMAAAVRAREISARELLELHLERIAAVNPAVNAIVSLDEERARRAAAAADSRAGRRAHRSGRCTGCRSRSRTPTRWPAGGPPTARRCGRRTCPPTDELLVSRIRAAGAVVIGRTNVPEFAAGSHTFNPVFGTTLNPWDLTRSAGGSQAARRPRSPPGMVPLADGSDMGGSLRNPASFCNVVGLRPSLGRVPQWPPDNAWETTSVGGPARPVASRTWRCCCRCSPGPIPGCPTRSVTPGRCSRPPLSGSLDGLRVALSVDLGGAFEVDAAVAAVVESAAPVFAAAGASVAASYPSLPEAEDTFRTLRAWHFQARLGRAAGGAPRRVQAVAGRQHPGGGAADRARTWRGRTGSARRWGSAWSSFFAEYDVLVMPVSQVPPFPADQEFPTSINGGRWRRYLDWMRSAYFITVTGCPAISVPAGFTPSGLPVGIQIVAPHNQERRLLEVAYAFEQATRFGERRPPL